MVGVVVRLQPSCRCQKHPVNENDLVQARKDEIGRTRQIGPMEAKAVS